jgi:hypothetical protein
LSSLALIAGLAVWVHDLATRDARAVPVVRALEGPARVQPEDPGGFQAAHQGFAVNDIASDSVSPPVGERVVLAPAPVGPAPEDIETPVAAAPVDPAVSLRNAIDGALSELLGIDLAPTAAPAPQNGAVVQQPRPQARPDPDLATRAAPDAAWVAAAARPATMDPALIAPGTRLVQLGSYTSDAGAQQAWAQLSARFEDYVTPKSRVIEPVSHAGTDVFRLQAYGFDTLGDARAFCAVLLAGKADCIPTLKR